MYMYIYILYMYVLCGRNGEISSEKTSFLD